MVTAIKEAKFLLPIFINREVENDILKEKTVISYSLLSTADNQKFLPVFTDWNELRKWSKAHEQTMVSSFVDLTPQIYKDSLSILIVMI